MSIRSSTDGRQQSRESVLQSVPAHGALRQADDQRTAMVPLDFLHDLRLALGPDFGDGARHLLYCTGFDWSLRDMARLGQRLRDELGRGNLDLWQMEAKFVLDAWWEPLAAAGWGACRFSALPHGLMLAELTASAPATACRESVESAASPPTVPTCDLCAGLFAGALSFFERAERHAVEVQCAALGDPVCVFITGAPFYIDKIETWPRQGLTLDEIRRRTAALPDAPA